MRWDQILPALATLLARLTGLQNFERDSPPKMTDPALKAKLEFAVIACSSIGRDERRYEYHQEISDPNARMLLTVEGTRQFTIAVKCISYDHSPMKSAEWFLERIYTKLSFPSSQAALNAVNVAWIGAASFQNLSSQLDASNRIFSVGQKDFFFTAGISDSNADDPGIGTIDAVVITSIFLHDVDGDPLGLQIGPVQIGPV